MILRKLIREQILTYFESDEWNGAMEVMARGRDDVLHAHIYADSILHPYSIQAIVEAYFKAKNRPVERKIKFLSHGRGALNVYYIQPAGMCHFEVFPRFTTETVLEPMDVRNTRGGQSFEFWDVAFMKNYYSNFNFATMGPEEERAVRDYFVSPAWHELYAATFFDNERNVHAHALVETSLSPEDILPLGREALEARGWDVDRGVSVVFGVNGYEQGKITYLVRKPELVLELEWIHTPSTVIRPAIVPVSRITTTDMVERDMEGVPYIELSPDDINWLSDRFAAK